MDEIDPAHVLREHGLRVTRQRAAVIDVLRAQPHSRAESVIDLVRGRAEQATGGRAVSVQAVYDVLNALTARGVVRRIQPAGAVARYELATGDNHHHAVCRGCGAMHDVECVVGDAPCVPATAPHDASSQALDSSATGLDGFVVDEAEVIYWGLCPVCQQAAPATATVPTATAG